MQTTDNIRDCFTLCPPVLGQENRTLLLVCNIFLLLEHVAHVHYLYVTERCQFLVIQHTKFICLCKDTELQKEGCKSKRISIRSVFSSTANLFVEICRNPVGTGRCWYIFCKFFLLLNFHYIMLHLLRR